MLNFIGTGSAFNTKLGNNSGYIKRGSTLFMIDCGSANFDRILKMDLLDGVEEIHVLLTHLHPDHVGSLGDLIFYAYYNIAPILEPKVIVHAPEDLSVIELLETMGVQIGVYAYNGFEKQGQVSNGDMNVFFIAEEVIHAEELENCYGYMLFYDELSVYYSGDSNMIPESVLRFIEYIDYFYQDTCKADYKGNVHMSLRKLTSLIPQKFRNKVYCMHLDKGFDISVAESLGFNVTENVNVADNVY